MKPTEERPDNWVDAHRRALDAISSHGNSERADMAQPSRYSPPGLATSLPASRGSLPQWMQDFGNVKTSIGNTIGSVAAAAGEQYIDPLKLWEPPKKRDKGDAGPVHNYVKDIVQSSFDAVGHGLDEGTDVIRAAAGKEPTSTYKKERGDRPVNTENDPNFELKRTIGAVGEVASPLAAPYTTAAGEIISHQVEMDPTLGPEYKRRLADQPSGKRESPTVRNQVAHEVVDAAVARLLAVRNDPKATDEQKNAADAAAFLLINERIAEFGGPSVGARALQKGGALVSGAVKSAQDVRASMKAADALTDSGGLDARTAVPPGVRQVPQGAPDALRARLGKTADQFADTSPKQMAAVDAMGKNFDEYIAKKQGAKPEPAGKYVDTSTGAGQRGVPNPELRSVASGYLKASGLPEPVKTYTNVDRSLAKQIADFYDATPDMAADPAVQKAYAAFNAETAAQAEALKAAGYVAEPWTKPGQPYANSAEMRADVANNKHIWYFTTQEGSPIHALMTPEQNDLFRWVHDIFGHALNGNEFGAKGEENAWLAHSQMYSPDAKAAMSTETRAQNSWVNYGPNGEANRANPSATVYPPQKALILPDEMRQPAGSTTGTDVTIAKAAESTMSEADIQGERARRATARGLAADEPNVGKRTWSDEEKFLLRGLDTGKFKAANILKQVRARTAEQVAVSRVWYEQLRRELEVHASSLGIDSETLAGVYASLSPNTSWPRGELHITEQGNAARVFNQNYPTLNNIKGAELLVKEWQVNKVLQEGTLSEIRAEMKRLGAGSKGPASQWTLYPNGSGGPGTGNAEKAIRILNGEDPKKVLRQKTGSFLDNFLGNEDNVTGDIWALRAALDDPTAKAAMTPKQYEQLQNAYRQAAAELGYTPEAVQAIVWDSVRENPRFARSNMTKNEIARLTGKEKFSAADDVAAAETAPADPHPIDVVYPTVPPEPNPLDSGDAFGGFGNPKARRNLTGKERAQAKDSTNRIVQMGEVSTTDAAKAYQIAKAKDPASRTAQDLVAMRYAEREGQGGGKADLGFQNDYFSPDTQHDLPAVKAMMQDELASVTAPITQADTLQAAQLSGRTPEAAAKLLLKRGQGAQVITEVALGVEEKMALADAAAAKLHLGAGHITPQERLDALFAIREAAGLLKDFAEGSSEAGRTLAARKIALKRALVLDPSDAAWREALKKVAGSSASPDKIDKLLEQLALVRGDKAATYRILRGLNKGSGWDMAFEYSQANILSAIPTHAVNVYSGTIQHALMVSRVVLETPITGALQAGQRVLGKSVKSPVGPEDVAAFAVGYFDGMKGIASDTKQLLRRRMDFYEYAQNGFAAKHGGETLHPGGAIPGRLGEIVRLPFKALTIEDMFQTAPAFNARLRQLAAREARAEGVKGPTAILKRAAEIARDPSDALFMEANQFAERYALHTRGDKLRAASALLESVPGLRYIVRFTTTPTNLVAMGLDHSPVGLLRLKDAKTTHDLAAITAEAAIGTTVITTFLGMLESGEMTGLRPGNKSERDLMEAEGVGPMMIQSSKVPFVGFLQNLPPFNQNGDANKRWVTGSVLGPLIVPYLIAAGIREVESQSQNPDPKAMQAAVGSMVRTFADQVPMLQGIGDVQNIIEHPMEGGGDLLAQTARTFIPAQALLSMAERMTDQYRRKPDGIVQTIQSIIPILASYGIDVGPLHVTPVTGVPDLLGRPVQNTNTGGLGLLPRGAETNDPNPVLVEHRRLAAYGFPGYTGVTKTTPTIGSGSNAVTLSPDGAARYQEIAGQLTERLLNELMNTPAYANLSDEDKAKKFQTKIDFARLEARKRLAEEYMGTITDDFGMQSIVARVPNDKALGISIGMRATPKLADRADFISSLLPMIESDPALRDAVAAEMSNKPRGPLQSGTISKVVDGDTVVIGDKTYRFYGVDAKEINTPEGRAAQKALSDFLTGKTITFQSDQQDAFGRGLVEMYANGKSVTDWLIDNGHGTVRLPPESDPNRYSLDVYRRVIPLRQEIKSNPVLSAEYTRNGQPFGDSKAWEEADRQKAEWDKARKAGDTIFQADQKYPVYAVYRKLDTQTGGKNPVRKKFIDDQVKKGIPLDKFVADIP